MLFKFFKVLTPEGYVTLNRMNIASIEPTDDGAEIVVIPIPYSEEPVTIRSNDTYENVLESYFAG